jgi:hypothetical protein
MNSDVDGAAGLPKAHLVAVRVDERGERSAGLRGRRPEKRDAVGCHLLVVALEVVPERRFGE